MLRVVGCFVEYQVEFLLLLRQPHKPQANTWCLPGGKVEAGETDSAAMIRELAEETGIQPPAGRLELLGTYTFGTVRKQSYEYITYRLTLDSQPTIQLEPDAHSAYQWITPSACYRRNDLIDDFHELLRHIGYAV
jgi:8-oxo-dGTP pyrophosphatase MutT (NUDIX family)